MVFIGGFIVVDSFLNNSISCPAGCTTGSFGGLFIKSYPLDEIWEIGVTGVHPQGLHFVPIFFVTVACGIVSGFHSTQATMIARTMEHEFANQHFSARLLPPDPI